MQPEKGVLSLSSSAAALENESFHIVDGLYQASLNGREAYISHSEAAALTCEVQRGATPGQMSLGREGLRDRAEWSGVTAVGATNASASSRRASAPGTLRHYLATRLEARLTAAFSRHAMRCPKVGSVVNRGCVSERYVPTNDSQSLSVRPCRARVCFTSPSPTRLTGRSGPCSGPSPGP